MCFLLLQYCQVLYFCHTFDANLRDQNSNDDQYFALGQFEYFPLLLFPSETPDTQAINSLLQQTQLEAKLAEERDSHENAEAEIEEVRRQLVLQTLFDCLMHCISIFKLPGQ